MNKKILKRMTTFSFLDNHDVDFAVIKIVYHKNTKSSSFAITYIPKGLLHSSKQEFKTAKLGSDYALFKKFEAQLLELSETSVDRTCQTKDLGETYSTIYVDWKAINNIGRRGWWGGSATFSKPEINLFDIFNLGKKPELAGLHIIYRLDATRCKDMDTLIFPLFKIDSSIPDEILKEYFKILDERYNLYISAKEKFDEISKFSDDSIHLLYETSSKQ